jgi:hypothetical protein
MTAILSSRKAALKSTIVGQASAIKLPSPISPSPSLIQSLSMVFNQENATQKISSAVMEMFAVGSLVCRDWMCWDLR